MKRLLIFAALVVGGISVAQTCILAAPAKPPTPRKLIVELPADGGTQGCFVSAFVQAGSGVVGSYPIGNAKCLTAVQIAQQAAAIDNGWADGGLP